MLLSEPDDPVNIIYSSTLGESCWDILLLLHFVKGLVSEIFLQVNILWPHSSC